MQGPSLSWARSVRRVDDVQQDLQLLPVQREVDRLVKVPVTEKKYLLPVHVLGHPFSPFLGSPPLTWRTPGPSAPDAP